MSTPRTASTLDRTTFETTVRSHDYVFRDHRVHGLPVLPGMFLLDLIYRVAPAWGLSAERIELRKLFFKEPIVGGANVDWAVQVAIESAGDVGRVSVRSRRVGDAPDTVEWLENAECQLHPFDEPFDSSIDLDALMRDATDTSSVDRLYEREEAIGIAHDDFMRVRGRVARADDYLLVQMHLGDLARQYLGGFFVHPVFLDLATGLPKHFLQMGTAAPDHAYIPLYVDSVRMRAGLQEPCYALVRGHSVRVLADDLIVGDVHLYDATGRLAASLTRLQMKRIRSASAFTGAQKRAVPLERLERQVHALAAEVLGRSKDAVDASRGFYEQGFDSHGLLRLIRRVEETLGLELYPTLPFEYTTVAQLAGYLFTEFGDRAWPPSPSQLDVNLAQAVVPIPSVAREPSSEDIAVIGVSGRYPLAEDLEEFWAALLAGRDAVTEVPDSRWNMAAYFDPDGPPGTSYARWGAFITDHDAFDPLFFHISPKEAEQMDPQERVFLETAWSVIEDAGYTRRTLGREVGVFVGVMWSDYALVGLEHAARGITAQASASFSTIANRVSYTLDFTGPSVPVDTACSSSLYAVHLACESIRRGECRAAIAGGVNLSLHPAKYLRLSELRMLSRDGRCRSFGAGGDGYVPGEGVGAVLLKPARQAIADGDQIYAVIKGSAVNHSGRTSGYAVPSPVAQAELVTKAITRAGVDPRTITYVEAHGTGTRLGDPIEIEGLNRAFRTVTPDRGFCAIGSVKSNIGHLESAAGIAALTKVLLCLKQRTLVPSLHSREINPEIEFSSTPFYVVQDSMPWPPARLREGEAPRRAGVSSFGAGGANAHIILEEWEPRARPAVTNDAPRAELVLLSAFNEDRLRVQATRLRQFLQRHPETNLRDLAYTLQIGREAHDVRLAIVAATTDALVEAIGAYLAGADACGRYWCGRRERVDGRDDDTQRLEDLWHRRQLDVVARNWVRGADLDSVADQATDRAQRISLPTYPFSRKRYWIATEALDAPSAPPALLEHPLLEAHDSTSGETCFRKHFTGGEPYLADHRFAACAVMPAAAFLEMARAAAAAVGAPALHAEEVAFLAPLTVDDRGADVRARVTMDGDRVLVEVVSEGVSPIVYVRCSFVTSTSPPEEGDSQSLEEVRLRCPVIVDGSELYAAFAQRGFDYRRSMRSILRTCVGDGEVLAEIEVPFAAATGDGGVSAWHWHPAMLDGALQAAGALLARDDGSTAAYLPSSIGKIFGVASALPKRAYAHVRAGAASRTAHRFDVDIRDAHGHLLLHLADLVLKAAPRSMTSGPPSVLVYEPALESTSAGDLPIEGKPPQAVMVLDADERGIDALREALAASMEHPPELVVVVPGPRFTRVRSDLYHINPASLSDYAQVFEEVRSRGLWCDWILHLWAWRDGGPPLPDAARDEDDDLDIDPILNRGVRSVFLLTKALRAARHPENTTIVFGYGEGRPLHSTVTGFARSVRLEDPRIRVKCVSTSARWTVAELLAECARPDDLDVYLGQDGRRSVRTFAPLEPPTAIAHGLFREGGVYLLTGGAGGLGLVVARHLARVARARLILTGRAPLGAVKQAHLAELAVLGADAVYLQADVTDARQMRRAIAHTRAHFGRLHGILHAAGVIEDALLVRKEPASFDRVLAAKVHGTLNLDRASADLPLDFFVLFSSASSVMGSVGQCDYAAGNAFVDAFAASREQLRRQGARRGRTVAIDWPLWRDGGMRPAADLEAGVLRKAGLSLLETDEGLLALDVALASDASQVVVLKGYPEVIGKRLRLSKPPPSLPAVIVPDVEAERSCDDVTRELIGILANLLKIPPAELDADSELGDYGVDSVTAVTFLDRVGDRYAISLPPALVTDRPTIRLLAEHLVAAGPRMEPVGSDACVTQDRSSSPSPDTGASTHVAVVAVACRFPGSPTPDAFWRHLIDGDDLIRPVPPDRWQTSAMETPSRMGGFIDGIDQFDPVFFGLSSEEAEWIDPQQRLVLELAQELLDRAGYTRKMVAGSTVAVYLGAASNEYAKKACANAATPPSWLLGSTLQNMIAARVCRHFDLRGPAKTIDTACSSSLVAIHDACRSLLAGDAEMAIAGGVELLLDPFQFATLESAGVLSSEGRTRMFDSRANGFVPGEGLGLVLLKPYAHAVRDGDTILAVVRGSAINSDGRTLGIAMPSQEAQEALLEQALVRSGVPASTIGYFEVSGAASSFADPLEIHAAARVFRRRGAEERLCSVGSVKGNIGALLHAGGVAAFIKVVLALHHGRVPQTLHFADPHPRFQFETTPFIPANVPSDWPLIDGPRRALVSSFGYGGTNCAVVVEGFDADRQSHAPLRGPGPLTVFDRKRVWHMGEPIPPAPADLSAGTADSETAARVAACVAAVGGASAAADRDAHLIEAGLESRQLVELLSQLEREFGGALAPGVLFEHPSVNALAQYFASRGAPGVIPVRALRVNRGERQGSHSRPDDDIAIIGMAGRFAASPDLRTFWSNILSGRDLVTEVPAERWDWREWYDPSLMRPGSIVSKWGSFIDDVTAFDAAFFNISPREAETLDPQIRQLLEVIFAASEDAGRAADIRGSRTGVYTGICGRDYEVEMLRRGAGIGPHDATGNASAMLANRPSFFLDLRGPSLAVDTACSSSLVALHLAVRALIEGECDMAFAAGVNLILSPRRYQQLSAMRALSPTGRCHAFDAAADGYVPGEGVAALLLKPLAAAQADGDPIHAVIKGSGICHGGHTSSITAPSPAMQAELLSSVWQRADIAPETLTYIEAHGTGTRLGDPIEVEGLTAAFRRHTDRTGFCTLSSVKANIGHLEAAAGVAGVIKTVLSMQHGQLPAMSIFRELNPFIQLGGSPFRIAADATEWTTLDGTPRRAGVSSFGFGGAYAHVVLEAPPAHEPAPALAGSWLFPFSAASDAQLRTLAASHRQFASERDVDLAAMAYTLQTGRRAMSSRMAIIAASRHELIEALDAYLCCDDGADAVITGANADRRVDREASPSHALYQCARQWVLGGPVTWPCAEDGSHPRRISLPTYPFARERFWFVEGESGPSSSAAGDAAVPASSTPPAALSLSYWQPRWVAASRKAARTIGHQEVILTFFGRPELIEALRATTGATVVHVQRAMPLHESDDGRTYRFDPDEAGDGERLLAALDRNGLVPDSCLFLDLERRGEDDADCVAHAEQLELWLSTLMNFVRAWTVRHASRRLRMVYAYPLSVYSAAPSHEAISGFARAVSTSDGRISMRTVGLASELLNPHLLAEGLARELADDERHVEVCCRPEGRVVRVLDEIAAPVREPTSFRRHGRYLVTGGLRGVGFLIARDLAERFQARLVLIGRSTAGPETDARLQELRRLGGDPIYFAADVTDLEAMSRCIAAARSRFGGLDGVLHVAGVLRDAPILHKSREHIAETLAPKTRGTLVLDRVTRAEPLEWFVLISSMSTVRSSGLLADYAAANRFLESFAARREWRRARGERHGRAVAISFPHWEQGGTVVAPEMVAFIRESSGLVPLPTLVALRILDESLRLARDHDVSQVVPAYGYADRIRRALGEPVAAAPAPPGSEAADPELVTLVEERLARLVAKILKLRTVVAVDVNLADYGLESLTVLELTRGVNAAFGVEVSAASLFEHRTLASYARFLVIAHAGPVRAACALGAQDRADQTRPASPLVAAAVDRAPAVGSTPAGTGALGIAIVGAAGVFPGSPDLDAFWTHLAAGADLVTAAPVDRFRWIEHSRESQRWRDTAGTLRGGFVADVESFDPLLFKMSPREATRTDPQQRLLLETVWRAIEDAAHSPSDLAKWRTGVFVGVSNVDYADVLRSQNGGPDAYFATGLSTAMIANRVSYFFDLRGPSESVNTACSSSLVALHRAVSALTAGDCDAAIVGGVNLMLSAAPFLACKDAGMLSPEGRCSAFDRSANGYVRGEGAGVVILRPLSSAIADGDRIHAVIRGSGVNHGGHAQGLTVPDPMAQAQLLRAVYDRAGIDPATITCIEAHGTGTALGDPIEINGLKRAFAGVEASARCGVGTVKSNIGHLEAAAGLAGLLKIVLALRHGSLPASIHCEDVNPLIELEGSPFRLITQLQPWDRIVDDGGRPVPRRAGVSSFGFGGVNAHVLVEEYEAPVDAGPGAAEDADAPQVFVLSAHDEERLAAYVRRIAAFLGQPEVGSITLGDLAYSSQVGRPELSHRLAVVARTHAELRARLSEFLDQGSLADGIACGVAATSEASKALAETQAGKQLIAQAVREQQLGRLARLWVEGLSIQWTDLHTDRRPRRVALPGYPFARQRCWPTPPVELLSATATPQPAAGDAFTSTLDAIRGELAEDAHWRAYDTTRMTAAVDELDVAARELLRETFAACGLRIERDRHTPREALERQIGVIPEYRRLFGAIVDILDRQAEAPTASQPASTLLEALIQTHPETTPFARFLQVSIPALPAVISGRRADVDVFFPNGDSTLVETIYRDNAIADLHSDLLARAIACFVRQRVQQRPAQIVRILEVGAGTGSSTAAILSRLGPYAANVAYRMTDVSVKFVRSGRERFAGAVPDIRFDALDIERDPQTQGFDPATFDVIVAANVLHATHDLPAALSHLGCLLDPSGLLALYELTRVKDHLTLSFGAFKAWWASADELRRGGASPLMDVRQWRDVLCQAGFDGVALFGPPGMAEQQLEHAVIVSTRGTVPLAIHSGSEPVVVEQLRRVFGELLHLPPEKVDPEANCLDYGVDSLVAVEICKRLEPMFGSLPKTLLFEHATIVRLAKHLIATRQVTGDARDSASAPPTSVSAFAPDAARSRALDGDIAIVGIAGMFPGSPDVETYWDNLAAGRELITEIPSERFDWREWYSSDVSDPTKTNSRWGGFIADVDKFDARFFNIAPIEAELMDPQQRLFLEIVHRAIEDAGYCLSRLRGTNTGVFVGVSSMDYLQLIEQAGRLDDPYTPSGVSHAVLANRISFLFDWHGPSEPVDTACSSSLVAVHRAIRALQSGDCELAVAGGVNVLLTPNLFVSFAQAGFLSPTGKCWTFDQRADGYVRAEGAGAVLLKPLQRALADGDHVYAVVRGSGVNHGGHVPSLTVPNPEAQAALIMNVYNAAAIDPATVNYVEMHGTGTSLGDPIEVEGLKRAFARLSGRTPAGAPPSCGLGAVKANVGHLEAAAGIAGLIKVVLAMRHGVLPPTPHLETVNPYIEFAGTPFYLVRELQAWPPHDGRSTPATPRRAAVSSFGFGGANAHILLEEAPVGLQRNAILESHRQTFLCVFSACSGEQLRTYAERFVAGGPVLTGNERVTLADIAYTLQVGRDPMPHRLAVIASTKEELFTRCRNFLRQSADDENVFAGEARDRAPTSVADIAAFRSAAAAGNDAELARLWVAGATIPWDDLGAHGGAKRVPLPTYPFARERYWVEERRNDWHTSLLALQRGELSLDEAELEISLNALK